MGAWGTKPFENDDAGDWLVELHAPIEKVVNKAAKARVPQNYPFTWLKGYAASETIIALSRAGQGFTPEILNAAVASLRNMLNDTRFVETWNDPRRFRADVNARLRELESIIARQRAHWQRMGWKAP